MTSTLASLLSFRRWPSMSVSFLLFCYAFFNLFFNFRFLTSTPFKSINWIFPTFSRSMMQLPLSSVCQRLHQVQRSLMIRRHVQCGATGSWPSGQVLRTCLIPVQPMERKRCLFCKTAGRQIYVESSYLLSFFGFLISELTITY